MEESGGRPENRGKLHRSQFMISISALFVVGTQLVICGLNVGTCPSSAYQTGFAVLVALYCLLLLTVCGVQLSPIVVRYRDASTIDRVHSRQMDLLACCFFIDFILGAALTRLLLAVKESPSCNSEYVDLEDFSLSTISIKTAVEFAVILVSSAHTFDVNYRETRMVDIGGFCDLIEGFLMVGNVGIQTGVAVYFLHQSQFDVVCPVALIGWNVLLMVLLCMFFNLVALTMLIAPALYGCFLALCWRPSRVLSDSLGESYGRLLIFSYYIDIAIDTIVPFLFFTFQNSADCNNVNPYETWRLFLSVLLVKGIVQYCAGCAYSIRYDQLKRREQVTA